MDSNKNVELNCLNIDTIEKTSSTTLRLIIWALGLIKPYVRGEIINDSGSWTKYYWICNLHYPLNKGCTFGDKNMLALGYIKLIDNVMVK